MAVHFKTSTPKKLLAAYKRAIDEARVTSWSYDKDGDFTHNPDQWKHKAWMRPRIVEREELVFNILGSKTQAMSSATYAVYHGRLIESFLRHCDKLFSEGSATAMAETEDSF